MDSQELTDWLAFYSTYPFTPERLSYELAYLRQTTVAPYSKTRSTLQDWLLEYGVEHPTADKLKAFLLGLAAK